MTTYSFKSVGEKFIYNENIKNRATLRPIGLVTPLRISRSQKDIFEMHYSPESQISDNLRNLILTNRGERLGLHDFGADLKPIIFDAQLTDFESRVMSRIKTAVDKFMPFVILDTFTVVVDNRSTSESMASFVFDVGYSVPQLGIEDKALRIVLTAGG